MRVLDSSHSYEDKESTVCEHCKNLAFGMAMSTAKMCGHQTTCTGQKYCQKCALAKRVCRVCGKSLDKKSPK